jgi:nucleoside-diphosphate-sugar epimerase
MKLLLTGASGFLGTVILNCLSNTYKINTLGRKNANLVHDLVIEQPVINDDYQIVVHAAGKAHSVPKTAFEKQRFYDVNVTGTQKLLDGLEKAPSLPKSFVYISSVAVYGKESGHLIEEDSELLAKDPYGKSKILAEGIVSHWCNEHNVICAILRLPLLAGANPPGNLKAMINGISKGYYFNIAGGNARKSLVLAKDVANLIPVVANIGGIFNLTDRYHPSFFELSANMAAQLQKGSVYNMPLWIAKILAKIGNMAGSKAPINTNKLNKIISELTFDDSKAVAALNWKPTPVLQGFKINS